MQKSVSNYFSNDLNEQKRNKENAKEFVKLLFKVL